MYIRWQRGIHGCRENYKKITRDHWTLCDTLYSIIRGTPRVVEQLRPTGYRINTLARRIYEKHTGGLRSFGRRLSLSDDFNTSPDSSFASICVCIYIIDRSCTQRFLLIFFFFSISVSSSIDVKNSTTTLVLSVRSRRTSHYVDEEHDDPPRA